MYELPTPEELKKSRLNANLTQTELAKRAGLSQSLIARIEAGDIDPRVSTLGKILRALMLGEDKKLLACDIMKSPVVYVRSSDTIGRANKLMGRYDISQLPVVDSGIPVGSISEGKIVKEISAGGDMSKLSSKRVRELMEDVFPTVSRESDIHLVSKVLETNPAVLVVDRGRIAGIVTKADIIKLMRG